MDVDVARALEHVHGHLGWLTVALLLHPAIVLRRPERRAHLAVGLAAAFVTVTFGLGAWVYVPYRERLKGAIFEASPSIGLLFERKEHLAFGVLALVWAGTAAYFGAPRATGDLRRTLRRLAFRAFASATFLALLVAAFGTVVAVVHTF